MIILPILFLITAILYSSVGFGGGSTYLALLLIWNVPYFILPVISLLCNIIVRTFGAPLTLGTAFAVVPTFAYAARFGFVCLSNRCSVSTRVACNATLVYVVLVRFVIVRSYWTRFTMSRTGTIVPLFTYYA